jgi:hypothetical protein
VGIIVNMGRPKKITPSNTEEQFISEEEIIDAPIDESQFYRGDKKIPKENAVFSYTPAMVRELDRCKNDIIYFAENYFTITHIDRGKEKISLYPKQKQALRSLMNNRFVCLLASRQCGKSTILTIYTLWCTCFSGDQRAVIVANNENTAIKIFKRIRLAYELLPNFLKPGVKEYGKTGVTFDNDSSIGISTTTSTAARGDTASILCIDEAAFIEPHLLSEFWKSVIPIVSSGKKTKIFMVSTPNGVGNKFYEIYSEAEKQTNGWQAERIDWWDVPGRSEKWKKQMIEALGSEEDFLQEFGNTFTDSGNSAVGGEIIERFKADAKKPIWVGEGGDYKVFEEPFPGKTYVIGVDVGEGIGRASSVAQVLDITDLTEIKQVATYGTNSVEPYHFANKLLFLCKQWGNPPLLIERNNCGGQVIDALFHKHFYEKLVSCSKLSTTGSAVSTRHIGVISHNNMRFASITNMRYWINTLQVVHVNDTDTIKELETFIRYPNGTYRKKNDTYFDDRVMSLVWGLFMLETEVCQQYFEVVDFDTQNKPLKITPLDQSTDPLLYKIGHLVPNHITDPNNTFISNNTQNTSAYESVRLDASNLYDMESDILDLDALLLQGYKVL